MSPARALSGSPSTVTWRALVVPAAMTLVGLVVLVSLGCWQVRRAQWKADLLARIDQRIHAVPGAIAAESEWPRWRASDDEYRRVRISGIFLNDKETLVRGNAPKDAKGLVATGFFVLTPLRLADGSAVIVNRGFVPDARLLALEPGARPDGEVTVTGLVRASQARGWFVPENEPRHEQWFTRNVDAITAARSLSRTAPFVVDAAADPSRPWPKGGLTVIAFSNNHLGYAVAWFGLAGALLSVFAVFARRSRLEGAARSAS